jgi:hypothetical protein
MNERPAHGMPETDDSPIDRLQAILDAQLQRAQQGRIGDVHALAEQAGPLVEQVQAAGSAAGAALMDSYRKLSLILTAEEDDVQAKLKQLHGVKRAIGAYGMSVKR